MDTRTTAGSLGTGTPRIAAVNGWTEHYAWTQFSSQRSAVVTLQAGQLYYIEALHKDGNGRDHLTVAWQPPGGTRTIIPGSVLCPAGSVAQPAGDGERLTAANIGTRFLAWLRSLSLFAGN